MKTRHAMTKQGKFNAATRAATAACQTVLDVSQLELLARNCPGLKTFDWSNYLNCSMCRIDKTLAFLESIRSIIPPRCTVFDCGSWLGNFSLALYLEGWNVVSSEMWNRYSPALDRQKRMLADSHIDVQDLMMFTGRPQGPAYSAVLLMSVIEHIPDSPRRLLKIIYDSLLPGGFLILDTPNLVTLANRRRLSVGLSCYPDIREQFITEAPFEGHVREYTADELTWMLETTGFTVVETDFFNYSNIPFWKSPIGQSEMMLDPTKKELIFMAARKPNEIYS